MPKFYTNAYEYQTYRAKSNATTVAMIAKLFDTSVANLQVQKFNLVSNSTLECAWERHFLDSAQLFKFIPPNAKIMYDFGSGAGFPGMVLAIMANEKTRILKVKRWLKVPERKRCI